MKDIYNRYHKMFKIVFYILLILFFGYLIQNELRSINWSLFFDSLADLPAFTRMALVIFGLLGFSFNGWYDYVATRNYTVTAHSYKILQMGWISQAFNEFIGLSGFTGAALRNNFYQKHGLKPKQAIQISLETWFASFLGLGVLLLIVLLSGKIDGYSLLLPVIYLLYLPLYFFYDKLPLARKLGKKFGLEAITWKKKLAYLSASLCDWVASFTYFYIVMLIFMPHLSPIFAMMVYSFANVVGILSFIPGGLGTFDLTVLLMMQNAGYNPDQVLAAIVILRVCYYVIPWLLACFYVFHNWFTSKLFEEDMKIKAWRKWIVRFVSFLLSVNGLVLISSVISPAVPERIHLLKYLIPRSLQSVSILLVLLIGCTAFILSFGLFKRIRRALWLTLILLPLGAIACMIKGLDYEEAIFLLLSTYLLYQSRFLFTRNHLALNRKNILLSFFACAGLLLIIFLITGHFRHMPFTRHVYLLNPLHIFFYLVIASLLTILVLFSRSERLDFLPPSLDEINLYEQLIAEYGGSEYSHLVYLKDKMIFFNTEQTVAILYRPSSDNLIALGDPIGNSQDFPSALEEFLEYAEHMDMAVGFYEVTPHYLDAFCSLGYATLKIGESAIIDLDEFTFEGKKNKNRRSVRNDMTRAGLYFEVYQPPYNDKFIHDLRQISDQWLNKREEMSFSMGAFYEDYLARERIAVLRDEKAIYAFASIMPISEDMISIDLMRYISHDAGDVMQMLILQLLQWAKDLGYHRFVLGMAPLANVGTKSYASPRDKTLHLVYDFGNRFYGFKGLRAYKSKFRPEWENRYIIYPNQTTLIKILISLLDITHKTRD
ncbi:bifunctional lysylphosphatidylglycerol flippase/synthetase MprF [Aerococcus urinae]|uniref:bifunctional lysylphosphatidylglycerol flippase/synthetase MprF n=1 Tax=Aerococcus urinae TaxID=1376 RepID=UPI00255189C0|nr:bifunctional lysylphosphatidylglycerol flippase/synthetase MprF [Aerococcus urinae]MDK7194794.1 bifunctional lysylphosphatidylglycerol flippase/synthetase MprF [Aerococcus urinae]MDK7919371.1 bifunctional lysylphosphatidylglycerol flippase/synthetase MprF [Aerococcus urinae]